MTLGPPLSDEEVKLLCVDDTLLRGVVEADGGEEEKEDDGDGGRRGLLMFFGILQNLLHDLNWQHLARLPGDMSEHLD